MASLVHVSRSVEGEDWSFHVNYLEGMYSPLTPFSSCFRSRMGALPVWVSGLLTLQMLLFVAGEQGEFACEVGEVGVWRTDKMGQSFNLRAFSCCFSGLVWRIK